MRLLIIKLKADPPLLNKSMSLSEKKAPYVYEDKASFEEYKHHLITAFEPLKDALDNTVRQNTHKKYKATHIALIDLKVDLIDYLCELSAIEGLPVGKQLQKNSQQCLEIINITLMKLNEHDNGWYQYPKLRMALGVFALILVLPMVATALFAPRGFWCTFFGESPEASMVAPLKAFQSHLHFSTPFIELKEPEPKPASTMMSLD